MVTNANATTIAERLRIGFGNNTRIRNGRKVAEGYTSLSFTVNSLDGEKLKLINACSMLCDEVEVKRSSTGVTVIFS